MDVPGKSRRTNSIQELTNLHRSRIRALVFTIKKKKKTDRLKQLDKQKHPQSQTEPIKTIYCSGVRIEWAFSQYTKPEITITKYSPFFHYKKAFMIECGDILATVKEVWEQNAKKHSLYNV